MELLDLMKVDMANFTLSQNRATIEQHSAHYEREQFMKYLSTVPGASDLISSFVIVI
jgi:hypothetical protein